MTKFNVGDKVRMPGVPVTLEVLEIGACDKSGCDLGNELFRFEDPETGGPDWMHSSEFELVT